MITLGDGVPEARRGLNLSGLEGLGPVGKMTAWPTRTSRDVRFRAAIGGIADVDVLRLTLLAPDIIEMILDGRQPPSLQFEQLRKSLPLEWQAQRDAIRELAR
jgi:hypothetical protein